MSAAALEELVAEGRFDNQVLLVGVGGDENGGSAYVFLLTEAELPEFDEGRGEGGPETAGTDAWSILPIAGILIALLVVGFFVVWTRRRNLAGS